MTVLSSIVRPHPAAWRTAAAAALAAAVALPLPGLAQQNDALVILDTGNVGMGLANPARQLHLKGDNAVFRMDRSTDSAAFMLVRTDASGNTVWKNFAVVVSASGLNNGKFVIQDYGTGIGGGGAADRLVITNSGDAQFSGTVQAPAFVQSSSARFKQDIATLDGAGRSLERLRGVRFTWKDTGRPALGLIAEEVATVYPELVAHDDQGAAAVNYAALVAVLVEAVKEQQGRLTAQEAALAAYRSATAAQQARVTRLEERLAEFETLMVRWNAPEGDPLDREPRLAAQPNP